MKRISCSTLVVVLAVLAISRSTPASAGGGGDREVPRFIIDTDMDNDDAAAIAYMCQEHLLGHVRLLGVTITNNGVGLSGKAINFVPLLESFDELVEANPRTGAARFVAAMVADPGVADFVPDGFLFWWDPLAAVAATTNGVVRYVSDHIAVVQSGPRQGALVSDPTGVVLRIGVFADQQRFQKIFLERLNALLHHGGGRDGGPRYPDKLRF